MRSVVDRNVVMRRITVFYDLYFIQFYGIHLLVVVLNPGFYFFSLHNFFVFQCFFSLSFSLLPALLSSGFFYFKEDIFPEAMLDLISPLWTAKTSVL